MSEKNSLPLVSVCMPIFNGGAYLAQAIGSVLGQSFANFELRIIDDASTDGSWEYLQQISDPRVSVERNAHNLGPEGNWNKALAAARGKYIKLFHQDDLLLPDCLARQVEALENHPQAVLAFCRRDIIGAQGKKLLSRGAGWPEGAVSQAQVVRRCARQGSNVVGEPSAVLLRADVVAAVGGFDASIAYLVDLDYWVRMMAHGPGWYSDAALAAFRVSPRQWSAAIGKRQGREFARFLDRLAQGALRGQRFIVGYGKLRGHVNGVLRAILYRFIQE
jgi:glycosyltransferase involved in cell wall biosynthesis